MHGLVEDVIGQVPDRQASLRIAYLHQYYNNRQMPGGTRSYEMARRLVARGHDVHVITTDRTRSGSGWRHTLEDGINVHWLPVRYADAMSYRRRMRAFAEFAIAAAVRARAVCPDLVFATSTPLTVAVPGVLAARSRRVPFVFEVRDLWPEAPIEIGALDGRLARRAAFALASFAYRNAAQIIALSPGMRDGIARHGYPVDRLTVIPNAADIDLFTVPTRTVLDFRRRHGWLGERPLVVYAGSVGLTHGVDYLVRLAVETRRTDPDVRFLVVGDGKDVPRVTALARDAGVLGDNFFMMSEMAKRDVAVVVASATVATSLVMDSPILRDNSANKFFDALAAGKPIAINYGGWHAALLDSYGAGIVLDPADPAASADRLVSHLSDPRWLTRAGAAARRLAIEQFSRDELFERFERVILEAAGCAREARPLPVG